MENTKRTYIQARANRPEVISELAKCLPELAKIKNIYLYNGIPCYLMKIIGYNGFPKYIFKPVDAKSLKIDLQMVCCYHSTDDKGKINEITIPEDPALYLCNHIEYWNGIQRIDTVATGPYMTKDGVLVKDEGVNEVDGKFVLVQKGCGELQIPNQPTKQDAEKAFAILRDEIYGDFPFANKESLSASIATVLTSIAMPDLKGNIPMTGILANIPGAGKGLTAEVNYALVDAELDPAASTLTNDDKELTKLMFSMALDGKDKIFFDNAKGHIESPALEKTLTSRKTQDRILGLSKSATPNLRFQILLTGNKCTLSPDLIRRSIIVKLLVPRSHAHRRTGLKITDLPMHVLKNREKYLSAIFTIYRAWIQARQKGITVEKLPMGSFVEWGDFVQSAIIFAGGADPVLTQNDEALDEDKYHLKVFLTALIEMDRYSFRCSDIIHGCFSKNQDPGDSMDYSILYNLLGEMDIRKDNALGRKLSSWEDLVIEIPQHGEYYLKGTKTNKGKIYEIKSKK